MNRTHRNLSTPNDISLGGKVKVTSIGVDVRTLTPIYKTQYGIYGDDFLSFGEFKDGQDPLSNEELLLKLNDDASGDVVEKRTFKWSQNRMFYEHQIDESTRDPEIHHAVAETEIRDMIDETWTETFFYGLGNKSI